MNWSKLPKEKKQHLILVAMLTVAVLAGLAFGLIKWQYGTLRTLAVQREAAVKDFKQMSDAINRAEQIEEEFNTRSKQLAEQEEVMASGDIYSWVVSTLRRFKLPYKVEIPEIKQPTGPGDVNLLPKFPYQQVTLRISGTGYFHDCGKFIADFENQFPHMRVVNLNLEPAPGAGPGEREKLQFTMDIIILVRPDAA